MKRLGAIYILGAQLICAVLALISVRIYTELLNPEQLGMVMLALSAIALADSLISMAIAQTTFYFATRTKEVKFFLQIANSRKDAILAFGAALPLVQIWLLSIAGGRNDFYLFLFISIFAALSYVASETLRSFYTSLVNAAEMSRSFSAILTIDSILSLIVVTLFLSKSPTIAGLLVGISTAKVGSLLFTTRFTKELTVIYGADGDKDKKPDGANLWRDFLKRMAPFTGMGMLGWTAGFADRYVVAAATGLSAAGIYSVSCGLVARPYNVVSAALTSHFKPMVFKEMRRSAEAIVVHWISVAALIGVTGFITVYLIGDRICLMLLAERYQESAKPLLPILCLAISFSIATHALDNLLLAKGEGASLLRIQIILLPIGLISVAIGGVSAGALGSACGKVVSDIARFSLMSYIVYKRNYSTSDK
jgi:O-antigen/teichoic acid export membrane protein